MKKMFNAIYDRYYTYWAPTRMSDDGTMIFSALMVLGAIEVALSMYSPPLLSSVFWWIGVLTMSAGVLIFQYKNIIGYPLRFCCWVAGWISALLYLRRLRRNEGARKPA